MIDRWARERRLPQGEYPLKLGNAALLVGVALEESLAAELDELLALDPPLDELGELDAEGEEEDALCATANAAGSRKRTREDV